MKTPLETGAKLKCCKYVTPKMTTFKKTPRFFASAGDKCLRRKWAKWGYKQEIKIK